MSFSTTNKLSFIDSFRFLSSLLHSLAKKLKKDDFKYLNQEFDNNVLDLVEQNGFYPHEDMIVFKKLKEELRSKEKIYTLLTSKKIVTKNMIMF